MLRSVFAERPPNTRILFDAQQSRWALICVLCRERVGACIQCSVKTCKTAYHVTCAFKHGLEMRAIIDDESTADDDNTVKLRVNLVNISSTNFFVRVFCNSFFVAFFSLIVRNTAASVAKKKLAVSAVRPPMKK